MPPSLPEEASLRGLPRRGRGHGQPCSFRQRLPEYVYMRACRPLTRCPGSPLFVPPCLLPGWCSLPAGLPPHPDFPPRLWNRPYPDGGWRSAAARCGDGNMPPSAVSPPPPIPPYLPFRLTPPTLMPPPDGPGLLPLLPPSPAVSGHLGTQGRHAGAARQAVRANLDPPGTCEGDMAPRRRQPGPAWHR